MKALSWILMLAIPAVLILWLYTRTPEVDARLRRTLRPAPVVNTPGCVDPNLNSEPPASTALAALRKSRPGKRGWLLINVGQCSSCLLEELAAWRKAGARHGYAPAFLTVSSDADLQGFRKNPVFDGVPIVRDPDRKLTQWLGQCFGPRAYVFDTKLRLAAIQQEPFPDPKDPFTDPGLRRAR